MLKTVINKFFKIKTMKMSKNDDFKFILIIIILNFLI